jgi:glutaminyl-peptide cyclotransferase
MIAIALLGCAKQPSAPAARLDPARFQGERAFEEARLIVDLGPREAGTPGAARAADHLRERLRAVGVSARLEVFTNASPQGPIVFRNVIGEIPGTGSGLLLVGSHYDTKAGIPGFLGANDSGSSCGALMELARVAAEGPRVAPTLRFVFFDGEECMVTYAPNDGLQGSRYHAGQLLKEGRAAEVRAFILLDMIGDKDLTVTLPRNSSPELLNAVLRAAHAENARQKFSLHPFEIGDDHVPFLEAGIPSVDLIDFAFGSAPGLNDYWHTPADTMDKISAESLGIVGRVTLRVMNDVIARPSATATPR